METRTVQFSINGWRRSLSKELEELRDIVQDVLNDEEVDKEELADAVNALICSSNSFNCISIEGMKGFSDMSDVEVALVETE